jgi:hypothetical protein
MKTKRGAILLAAIALVALAVAVPVVAGSVGTPGATGTLNFVNVNQYGPNWQSAPPINPRGPVGSLAYTASVVTTQTEYPQEIVKYTFSASRLCPGKEYALVNIFGLHTPDAQIIDVYILGRATANKAGVVCIKGIATLDELAELADNEAWGSGARLRLVPDPDANLHFEVETDAWYVDADCAVLFSVLGIPLILPENWVPDAP